MKFHPGINILPGWNHPCLWWSVSYCLQISLGWHFIPEWTNSFQNDKDEISSWDDKKEKKTYKHFILGWNFTRYHEQNCIIILQWYIIRLNKMYYYESLSSALWNLIKAESMVRITSWGSIMVLYFWKNIFTQIYKI